jgi:LCP family protein required for cell wall assembly
MRTTLKRGIGRTASAKGNGSGNGRAVLPPVARTPMRRYMAPAPPRRSGWSAVGWFFRWLGFALLLVVTGLAGGAYLYEHQTTAALQAHSENVKKARTQLNPTVPPPSQPAIALLIGYDKRAGADATIAGSRSDTIMLARADPQKKVVSLLSFPRDLVVPIYCEHGPIGVTDRINSAWSRCGASGTVATVAALTGIRPDYLITVDFHGFKLLVNKLHGVYMDVDHRYLNTQGGPGGYATINLEPGYQRLNGGQALSFVRFRHTDSDLYRLARQQLFLTALRERIADYSIFAIPKIIGAMKGNMEIENGAGSALSTETVLSFLQFAHGLSAGRIFRDKFDNLQAWPPPNGPEIYASQSSIQQAVAQFESPDLEASAKANAAALGVKPKPRKEQLRPGEITTLVLNGTSRVGLAANTSYGMAKLGYRMLTLANGQPANAPSQAYAQTQVYFAPDQPRAHEAAQQLQKLFPGAVIGPFPREIAPYARNSGNPLTVVVLGSTFDGTLQGATPPPPDTTPKHEPPAVTSNPGLTLTAIRDVRSRLSFAPEVPHAIESHSALAALTPVRVYKPASGHTALRLTFVLPTGNEYWGIEETDWTDAPLLRNPSETRTIGGRRFDFYYSGSHLHVIALRTPTAAYWVVNTLLDKLSNETMIAIAKGLQPLGAGGK